MPKEPIPPSISETAFDCPHCGAYTTQYWFEVYAKPRDKNKPPHIPNEETKKRISENMEMPDAARQNLLEWCIRMDSGLVFLTQNDGEYVHNYANNLNLSKCYNCKKFAIWVHGNLVFPSEKLGVPPNPDLPDDIVRDYEEARGILGESPRGAAALLRLCIQKLCKHLGEKGRNIDDDIASTGGPGCLDSLAA